MGLRQQAELDLREIVSDTCDFGNDTISLTSPDKVAKSMTGFSTDIYQTVDPDTGLVVAGRTASVALPIAKIYDSGFTSLPRGVDEIDSAPWLVTFDDILGRTRTFKVQNSLPDREVGIVILILEAYSGS